MPELYHRRVYKLLRGFYGSKKLLFEIGHRDLSKVEIPVRIIQIIELYKCRLWVSASDGLEGALYQSQYLISPRFYVTEDEMQDITATMLIPYTHFELDMLELEDFITAAIPSLLDGLSMPVFLLLEGRITTEEAIDIVRVDIIGERGRM